MLLLVATCFFFLVERLDFFFWVGIIAEIFRGWVRFVSIFFFLFYLSFFLWGFVGGFFLGVVINQLPI